jgi:hypothetical protein
MHIYMTTAIPADFASILYFTFSKSHFSILITNFYKTPHIPFSILQSFYLNILSLFLFVYFFYYFHFNFFVFPDKCNNSNKETVQRQFFSIWQKFQRPLFYNHMLKANCVQILSTSFFSSLNKDSYIHPTIFIKIHISSSIFFQDSLIFTLYFSLYGSLLFLQITS